MFLGCLLVSKPLASLKQLYQLIVKINQYNQLVVGKREDRALSLSVTDISGRKCGHSPSSWFHKLLSQCFSGLYQAVGGLPQYVKFFCIHDKKPYLIKRKKLDGVEIHYINETSCLQMIDELLVQKAYHFTAKTAAPRIIDCGSNIGISLLAFKLQYPNAVITCFEPNPLNCQLIKRNIKANQLFEVSIIQKALWGLEGTLPFYGDHHPRNPNSLGDSLIEAWGVQRTTSGASQVEVTRLSNYIDEKHPVDCLKLDIEGAEISVLNDLEVNDKLQYIDHIFLEVHDYRQDSDQSVLDYVLEILERNQFHYQIIEQDIIDVLPEQVRDWALRVQPKLYIVSASLSWGIIRGHI